MNRIQHLRRSLQRLAVIAIAGASSGMVGSRAAQADTVFEPPHAPVRTKCVAREWAGISEAPATVVRGVDGDTVIVNVKGREFSIRMLSIDTPETHYQGQSQGYWGEVAADHLKKLLPVGAAVRLVLDVERCDRFGRLLATVFKGRTNINQAMIRDGFAFNYCIAPNLQYCDVFAEETRLAQRARRGVHGDTGVEVPYEWRRKTSGRAREKWVGDIRTKVVFEPEALDRVPLAERVFFMTMADIKPPYRRLPTPMRRW